MGDNRVNVEIRLTGFDGKVRKIDWWLNWHEDIPQKLHEEFVLLAQKSGLPVNPFLTDEGE